MQKTLKKLWRICRLFKSDIVWETNLCSCAQKIHNLYKKKGKVN
jgi:hypothetical protein